MAAFFGSRSSILIAGAALRCVGGLCSGPYTEPCTQRHGFHTTSLYYETFLPLSREKPFPHSRFFLEKGRSLLLFRQKAEKLYPPGPIPRPSPIFAQIFTPDTSCAGASDGPGSAHIPLSRYASGELYHSCRVSQHELGCFRRPRHAPVVGFLLLRRAISSAMLVARRPGSLRSAAGIGTGQNPPGSRFPAHPTPAGSASPPHRCGPFRQSSGTKWGLPASSARNSSRNARFPLSIRRYTACTALKPGIRLSVQQTGDVPPGQSSSPGRPHRTHRPLRRTSRAPSRHIIRQGCRLIGAPQVQDQPQTQAVQPGTVLRTPSRAVGMPR